MQNDNKVKLTDEQHDTALVIVLATEWGFRDQVKNPFEHEGITLDDYLDNLCDNLMAETNLTYAEISNLVSDDAAKIFLAKK